MDFISSVSKNELLLLSTYKTIIFQCVFDRLSESRYHKSSNTFTQYDNLPHEIMILYYRSVIYPIELSDKQVIR